MQRSIARLIVTLIVVAGLGAGAVPPLVFAGAPLLQDGCPEPNDEFQAACQASPAEEVVGIIGHPDDVDAYRFEVLDFDTLVQVTLTDVPAPYEAYIADWRGELIAASVSTGERSELAQAALRLPGSYYIFVRSRTGQFSERQPYHLGINVDYGSRPIRQVLFAPELLRLEDARGMSPDGSVEFVRAGGKITMNLQKAGSSRAPEGAYWPLRVTQPPSSVHDFAIVSDVRVTAGANAGLRVTFGESADGQNRYAVVVDLDRSTVSLTRFVDGKSTAIVGPQHTDAADTKGGVNRIVVQVAGSEIRVALNGADLLRVSDLDVPAGQVKIGVLSWGPPISANFDNVLLTVPSGS